MASNRRFALGILPAVLLAVLAGGCWDQVGMADRTLVVGIGIDRVQGEEPILLTAQMVNFSAFRGGGAMSGAGSANGTGTGGKSSASNSAVVIETSVGKTLAEAIHRLMGHSARQLTFSHNRMVILGKETVIADIDGILDEMARDFQFRPTNWILLAETTAKEALESGTDLGTIPAQEINKMMLKLMKNAFILPVNQNDLIFQLKSEGKTGLIPLVQIERAEADSAPRIRIERMAVFQEHRFLEVLTTDESEGLLWLAGRQRGGMAVFPGQTGKEVAVEITDGASRIMPRLIDGAVMMEIRCAGRGLLREAADFTNDPRTIAWLERMTAGVLKARVERTIDKARRLKADFLGFSRLIHADYPDLWHRMQRDWAEEFARMKVSVHFQVKLARHGGLKDSVLKKGVWE